MVARVSIRCEDEMTEGEKILMLKRLALIKEDMHREVTAIRNKIYGVDMCVDIINGIKATPEAPAMPGAIGSLPVHELDNSK